MRNKIKEVLRRRGIKVSYVLAVTGFSKSYFYDVMKGKTIPSLLNARKIAEVIEVHLDELFPVAKPGRGNRATLDQRCLGTAWEETPRKGSIKH